MTEVRREGIRRRNGHRRTCLYCGRIATVLAERPVGELVLPVVYCEEHARRLGAHG